MGFDEGRIIIDSANGAYYPGQTLYGRLEFDQDKVKTFRGIYVEIKGSCEVEWTTSHTRRENDRTVSYTVKHSSYEQYLFKSIYLAGGKNGDHQLNPGHHSFPFECIIPASCPSSFEGSNGHVRYQIKAVVDRAFKFDQQKLASFRVIAPLDLNTCAIARDPIEIELYNSFCCCCMSSGSAETLVKLPVSGFCPGQVLPIELSCTNKGNVDIDKIKFTVKKHVTFRAVNAPDTREESDTIMSVSKGPVAGGNTRNWTVEMEVPAMDVPNLTACSYIDITFTFKVSLEVDGCHEGGEEKRPIVIGTVPLVGVQDNIPNPLQDQMPQQFAHTQYQPNVYPPPPITTQPTNSYPGIPNTQSPFPAPYPGAQPYPPPYSETPPQNPPYPQPVENPFISPNPQPGVNPPYPVSPQQTPFPNSGSYPTNTPYPAPQPYPSPNPPFTGTAIKTGTLGFAVQTSLAPYPPPARSPFVGATAPEPSTPVDEKENEGSAKSAPYPP